MICLEEDWGKIPKDMGIPSVPEIIFISEIILSLISLKEDSRILSSFLWTFTSMQKSDQSSENIYLHHCYKIPWLHFWVLMYHFYCECNHCEFFKAGQTDHGFPWWLRQKRISLKGRRPGFSPWVKKIPWRRAWLPTPVFLLEVFHGQRSLAGYSPWGCKELHITEWLALSNRPQNEIQLQWNRITTENV